MSVANETPETSELERHAVLGNPVRKIRYVQNEKQRTQD